LFRISQNTYLHPIAMLRYVEGAPVQADLGALFYVNKSIWVGPSYRLGDSFSAIFSYEITKSLKVGYAYDFTITKIQNHLGSHELYLGFNLIKKSDGYYHPRFF
jgi:type IX secretion system PorP/SprF family membrane protein